MKIIGLGPLEQPQAGIFERSITFAVIARAATCDEVVPGRVAAARPRDDVIQGQILRGENPRAVLASIMVAKQDVLA